MYHVLIPNMQNTSADSFRRALGSMFKLHVTSDPYKYTDIDLVLFAGGADVSPKLYNEQKHPLTSENEKRDEEEIKFFKVARANNWPMVGICRGAQFLNVMSGGRLVQHVRGHNLLGSKHEMHVYGRSNTIMTNSTHHQMLHPTTDGMVLAYTEELSDSYELPSREPDKGFAYENTFDQKVREPEVVYYKTTNALCVQYHPEYIAYHDEKDPSVNYFRELVGRLIRGKLL